MAAAAVVFVSKRLQVAMMGLMCLITAHLLTVLIVPPL